MTIVRELVTKLSTGGTGTRDLGAFSKAGDRAKTTLTELNSGLELVRKGFGLLRGVVQTTRQGFDFLIADVAKIGDNFAKEAKKIGTTATALQELSFAAERSGADQTKLVKATARMVKNLNDARTKGVGPLVDQFADLGISVSEFDGLSPDAIFAKLADVTAGIEDPVKRGAFAIDAFGKSGRDLIPLLNEGSAGIQDLRDEAQRLGLSMSDETAAASEEFQDRMLDLTSAVEGVRFELAGELLPIVTEVIQSITEWTVANRDVIREELVTFLRDLIESSKGVAGGLLDMIKLLPQIIDGIGRFIEIMGGPAGAVALVSALKLGLGGMPGLFVAAGAAGFAMGQQLMDALTPVERRLASINAQIDATRKATRNIEKAQDATKDLHRLASEGKITTLSEKEFERKAEALLRGAATGGPESRARAERILAGFDKQRREARAEREDLEGVERTTKFLKGQIVQQQRATIREDLQSQRGAGPEQVAAAEREFVKQVGQGATPEAARKAAFKKLDSLTGRRGGGGRKKAKPDAATATDDELLGLIERATPGAAAGIGAGRGVPKAQAPIVTVTINQTNIDQQIDVDLDVNGVPGTSAEDVARMTSDGLRSLFREEVRAALESLQPVEQV